MSITHVSPREQALERENARLLDTVRFQAKAIALINEMIADLRAESKRLHDLVCWDVPKFCELMNERDTLKKCLLQAQEAAKTLTQKPTIKDSLTVEPQPVQDPPGPANVGMGEWLTQPVQSLPDAKLIAERDALYEALKDVYRTVAQGGSAHSIYVAIRPKVEAALALVGEQA